ncbi:uncharacterized protein LOC114362198 [Ostrinia furnacalis]|uniref:uncharacterized protein LOC114362198 n=1 Tax=Ostrinia furnacalis TaxID=93504 RepID=UPI00103E705C|nr:uncharacterized protein LOC114362198 [Ostrinia furnacalis]
MRRWQAAFYLIVIWTDNSLVMSLLSGNSILKIIPDFLNSKVTESTTEEPNRTVLVMSTVLVRNVVETTSQETLETTAGSYENLPDPPDESYPVQYAGVPQNLQVFPLPLPGADHELMFNVSWESSLGEF